MTLSPQIASARISRQLKAAESQSDLALLEFSRLMTEIVQARQSANVESHTGQDALIRLARAQMSVIEGTSDLLRVHDAMYRIGREMGILEEKASLGQLTVASDDGQSIAA
jgi:hypothetical protein